MDALVMDVRETVYVKRLRDSTCCLMDGFSHTWRNLTSVVMWIRKQLNPALTYAHMCVSVCVCVCACLCVYVCDYSLDSRGMLLNQAICLNSLF